MTAEGDGRPRLAWRVGRGLLLATGGVVFCVGLAAVFVPETVRMLPVEAAVLALGSDYVVVAVVGLLAVGLSTLVIAARHVRGVQEANPPVVEGVQSASYPGTEFDRAAGSRPGVRGSASADCRARLREAAIHATMRTDGCPRDVAARRVTRGEWTDDPVAVRYLRDPRHADGAPNDDGTVWSTNRDERAIHRTVDAIAEVEAGARADGSGEGRRTGGETP
jgi:hypothetical protein